MMNNLKIYVCTDHDYFYPVGVASIVITHNEQEARNLLDRELIVTGLKPFYDKSYTLKEIEMVPNAIVLADGDY